MDFARQDDYPPTSSDDEDEEDSYNSRMELEHELYSIVHYGGVDGGPSEALSSGRYTVVGEGNELTITKEKVTVGVGGGPVEGSKPADGTPTVEERPLKAAMAGSSIDVNSTVEITASSTLPAVRASTTGGTTPDSVDFRGVRKPQGKRRVKRFYELVDEMGLGKDLSSPTAKKLKADRPLEGRTGRRPSSAPPREITIVTISDDEEAAAMVVPDVGRQTVATVVESDDDDVIINAGDPPPLIVVSDSEAESSHRCPNFNWRTVVSPDGWTRAMRRYYNAPSKRLAHMSCFDIIHKIRQQGHCDWWISDLDRFPNGRGGPRCLRCRGRGHKSWACPALDRRCHMCSLYGHSEPTCPDKMCLNCGLRMSAYQPMCDMCLAGNDNNCLVCKRHGHWEDTCTDIWRRYHNTVSGDVSGPSSVTSATIAMAAVAQQHQPQCSNCTGRGHLFEDCPRPYWSMYPVMPSVVANYDGVEKISKGMRFYTDSCMLESEVDILDELVTRNRHPGGHLRVYIGTKKEREGVKFVAAKGTLGEMSGLRNNLFAKNLWPRLRYRRRRDLDTPGFEARLCGPPPRKRAKKSKPKKKKKKKKQQGDRLINSLTTNK